SLVCLHMFFLFSSRRRHTRFKCDWSSDVCSSDLDKTTAAKKDAPKAHFRASHSSLRPFIFRGGSLPAPAVGGRAPKSPEGFNPRSEERRVGKEGTSSARASELKAERERDGEHERV